MDTSNLKMYSLLAEWWPLLSAPEDYYEEAMIYKDIILKSDPDAKTLLELGSGGGNNASHMKKYFSMTLVDISPEMLKVSEFLNPECEHYQGDMRDFRINIKFDAVFIHDAVMYFSSEDELGKVLLTANLHCKLNGHLLVVPDCFKETFKPYTKHGGHDKNNRSLRYLEWAYDPDPDDNEFNADFAIMLKEGKDRIRVEYDSHILGIFSSEKWCSMFYKAGFKAEIVPINHSELETGMYNAIPGIKMQDL